MQNLDRLNRYRVQPDNYVAGDHGNGMFQFRMRQDGPPFKVIASSDCGWDHVSVSTPARCPTWEEMETVRRMFFEPHETVMQLHPPLADYVNDHPFCLHLWRPQAATLPRPPQWMIGGMSQAEADAAMHAEGW